MSAHPAASDDGFEQAVRAHEAGDLAGAEAAYRELCVASPDDLRSLYGLALVLHEQGKLGEAVAAFQALQAGAPTLTDIPRRLADIHQAQGEHALAERQYRRALAFVPDDAEGHYNLGVVCEAQGRREAAVEAYRAALTFRPDFAEALVNLGNALSDLGRPAEAIALYQHALAVEPGNSRVLMNLGDSYARNGDREQSGECFRAAAGQGAADNALGMAAAHALHREGHNREAQDAYRVLLHQRPDFAPACNNLAYLLWEQRDYDAALRMVDQALAIDPEYADGHVTRALMRLAHNGDWRAAWEDYEWRWRQQPAPGVVRSEPLWDGARFDGKTLLIHAEQAFGDTFQFARYVALAKARGGRVILEVQPGLAAVMAGCLGADEVVERPHAGPVDWQIPLLSLPRVFGTTADTIPAGGSYLRVDPDRVDHWRARLSGTTGPRIGLVWAGRPKWERNPWRNRSCPLAALAPLAALPGVQLFSLQKGFGLDQLASAPFADRITDLGPALHDFADTAAAITQLDLVITVDSAVAHLAGALGRPAWVLLAHSSDWRWQPEDEQSRWYPSQRLFRQPAPGDWHGAVASLVRAWQDRANAARDYEHGNALAGARRYEDAAVAYLSALQRDPHSAGAWNNLGNVLQALGRHDESGRAYRQAIALVPDYAVAHNNLGVGLKSQARLAEAETSLREAIRINPAYSEAWNNLGNVLRLQDRNHEAVTALNEAVRLNPVNADAWTNLGVAHQADNRLPEALAALTRATELAPAMAEAQWNLAIAQLLAGDLPRGFAGYESGFRTGARPTRSWPMPRWSGEALDGKRILVWAEQGFGDTFQFVRFLPLLQLRGATVILECQKGLKGVLNGCPGADAVIEPAESAAQSATCDFHIPLMSLPALFGTTRETIPPLSLSPEPARVEAWRARLPAGTRRIGFVWAGRPQHQNDRNRSCPLAAWAPLADLPDVTLISLQKGEGAEQLKRFVHRDRVMDLGATLTDFIDTAAVIANLDLVVTVDTSVAHLAGALGRPVWILLPFAPDWRWQLDRDDSPWYPSARLFRQSTPGDWDELLVRVARALGAPASLLDARGLYEQGNRAIAAGQLEAAEDAWQKSIPLAPGWAPPLFNLAVLYRQTNRPAQGHALLEQAALGSPRDANVLSALAVSCEEQGEVPRARELLDRAVAAEPGNAGAHVNRALIRLGQGDYAGGFAEYEWREALRPPPAGLASIPRWDGSRFEGRTLLVYAEQGYGDLFQFARFLPLARSRGGRVVFHTLAGTREVMHGIGVDIVTEQANGEAIDWQIPLVSLPGVLGITADNLPVAQPYLHADPARVERWRPALAATGRRVGIVWAGREQWPGNPYRERACPPALLFSLVDIPGVQLYSLQKEHRVPLPTSVIDIGSRLGDFADTAAVLSQLDLVIAVDTGVAHLAGALNCPVWVLLPSTPDWRWTTPSPGGWYPGARVFRQPHPGDWEAVLAAVAAALQEITTKQ